jgi:hypothetical protein
MRIIIKPLVFFAVLVFSSLVSAASYQIGISGLTQASTQVTCSGGIPTIEVALVNPKPKSTSDVSLNGSYQVTLTKDNPSAVIQLNDGNNIVDVAINLKKTDSYIFDVSPGLCDSGNTSDGTFEYGVNDTSKVDITTGCMWNGVTGQPYVHVYRISNAINISLNSQPVSQLIGSYYVKVVPLNAGANTITTALLSGSPVDSYVRDGGDGTCLIP